MKKIIIVLCLLSAGIASAMNFEQTKKMLTDAIQNECITPAETTQIINAIPNISPQNLEILISLTNSKLTELYGRRDELKGFLLAHTKKEMNIYYDILTHLVVH